MKYQYTADEFESLSDEQKKGYGAEKDGIHTAKLEGLPDYAAQDARIAAMDSKIADLLTETKTAKKAKKDAEKQAADDAAAAAQKSGDVDAINASWQTKYDDGMAGLTTERDEALTILNKEKVHSKALEMATTLAIPGSASLLMPVIEPRLAMEIKDGRAVTSILDVAGKPSALTFDELSKEIANNPAYAPVIVASNAAGGGANGTQRGGAAQNKTVNKAQWADMNPSQKMEFSNDGGQVTET